MCVSGEQDMNRAGLLPPRASDFSPFIISNEAKPSGTNISLGYDRLCPYTVLHPSYMMHLPLSMASWEICTDSICTEMVSLDVDYTSLDYYSTPNHTVTKHLSSGFIMTLV